ncbi:MAG: accessory factor UbiK family protein [Alphaproteobacteria bacterium]|nr:accessory factor UbiK family protein [Alphaproteobacteria bacterium]MBE8220515.1 accessory factor UbiK family protein [Alphaproteobacteria bacterium]
MDKILSDLSGMLTGAGVIAQSAREEFEQALAARLDAVLASKGFVAREEFEAVREMAVLARQENESLRAALEELKQK